MGVSVREARRFDTSQPVGCPRAQTLFCVIEIAAEFAIVIACELARSCGCSRGVVLRMRGMEYRAGRTEWHSSHATSHTPAHAEAQTF